MVEDFITRALLLILGYAYPAMQCFKSMERSRAHNEELRFWCQYWIIIAILTVIERVADAFLSWLPMYGEVKLALIIYLWYPKTKGSDYIYDRLLRPFVTNHETDFEMKLKEWRAKAWDLAIFYWQNCTELGGTAIFQIFEHLTGQAGKNTNSSSKKSSKKNSSPPPPPPPNEFLSFYRPGKNDKRPSAPPLSSSSRMDYDTSTSNYIQTHFDGRTDHVHMVDDDIGDRSHTQFPHLNPRRPKPYH